MAKVKVINNNLDQNLNGNSFDNTVSQTIFKFGKFKLTSNFDGRIPINYENELSTFVKPVNLEKLNLTDVESENITFESKNAILNLDRTNLNTFTQFGSAFEFLKASLQNIIFNYPGSLYVDSNVELGSNLTFFDFTYDEIKDISTFKIPSIYTVNKFNLIFNRGNNAIPNDNRIKNLNLSYSDYVVWSSLNPDNNTHTIIGFTGDTIGEDYITVKCLGNPFPQTTIENNTVGSYDIHLKPNKRIFDNFKISLKKYEKHILSKRKGIEGFEFSIKDPILLDNGQINYSEKKILWSTSDGYNIDYDSPSYDRFLDIILTIGNKFDQIKTDLIARFLTPASIKTYDLTDDKKMTKLLRIYGAEFDQLKQFIDSLVYINKTTYNKKKNAPDQVISNLARTFGWDHFSLLKEDELVNNLLNVDDLNENTSDDLTPAEVDIELWRRILINTNYFWKSKGTRDAIKSMFLLIGIPEPFINITEYVYTVDGKIDPRTVDLTLSDLPSASLPYNNDGYPIAPQETPDFYFQVSGDTDSGQAYMDVFRQVGFDLNRTIDNKKSWVEAGKIERKHYSTPNYYQEDSKLILNTKEVDVALDVSRGLEYDVYKYIKDFDFPINSTGYTSPYVFVNISTNYTSPSSTFTIPDDPKGHIQVNFNGITLTSGSTENDGDYYINPLNPREIILHSEQAIKNDNRRDVVVITYLYEKSDAIVEGEIKYVITKVTPNIVGTKIPLPEEPKGTVQLTLNGVSLTQGTTLFNGDYIINPNNREELIIQNNSLISFLQTNQVLQVAYISADEKIEVEKKAEFHRVDSYSGSKFYKNNTINKFIYKLNFKINKIEDIKFTINGITLEPKTDYQLNNNNQYEIILPPIIKYGDVLSAYYIIGGNANNETIISDIFNLGDISEMSFLEFLGLVESKMINTKNRKTITDANGGFYPTIGYIYSEYLKRNKLEEENPLKSNGYTYSDLYPFLNKYNAFFKNFVSQLLPATIILRKGGILIRNTIFTKQKFTYRRGVNFNPDINWLGDDGSEYKKLIDTQIL